MRPFLVPFRGVTQKAGSLCEVNDTDTDTPQPHDVGDGHLEILVSIIVRASYPILSALCGVVVFVQTFDVGRDVLRRVIGSVQNDCESFAKGDGQRLIGTEPHTRDSQRDPCGKVGALECHTGSHRDRV